jgi:hypothetical protein
MWQSKREISRECSDIIGSAKGSQISEKYWFKFEQQIWPHNIDFLMNYIAVLFAQALVSFKKYMPPPLPYFKINICPFPLLLKHLFKKNLNQFRPDRKWLYPFQWIKSTKCDVRWIYFYNLHWNNYLYFKGLLYIWEMIQS